MADPEPYICLTVSSGDSPSVMWILESFDVNGIENFEAGVKGFWPKSKWKDVKDAVMLNLSEENITEYSIEEIPFKNWNAEWESNFNPIRVDDFCYIRAPFHPPIQEVEHDIVIDPKMAFGTGHHATTYQMIKQMSGLEFFHKKVFDFGTGTGILAIIAYKKGADDVLAIDNDPLATDNTRENILQNNTAEVKVEQATIEQIDETSFDMILANINLNVLLNTAEELNKRSKTGTVLLMSGFYLEDLPKIKSQYAHFWKYEQHTVEDKWCCAKFLRK